MRILLIEGDLESAKLTRKVLAQHGYELAIATSAAEALAQLAIDQHGFVGNLQPHGASVLVFQADGAGGG